MINSLIRLEGEAHYNKWYLETTKDLKIGKADFDAIRQDFLNQGIVTRRTGDYGKKQKREYYKLSDFPYLHLVEKYPDPLPENLEEAFTQMSKSEKKYLMKDLASRALYAVDSALLMTLILHKVTGHDFYDGLVTGWVKKAQNLFELFRRLDSEVASEIFHEWERTRTLQNKKDKKSRRLSQWLQKGKSTKKH
jgi:hypothetical protein